MDETIARLNIEHLREKLAKETDKTMRKSLRRRLAEEETKLNALKARAKPTKQD
jgi:hypothetical protein